MSYNLPGVSLTEARGAPTPFLSSLHRRTAIVGKIAPWVAIENEVVIRSEAGFADNFEFGSEGVLSIQSVQSQIGLKDFQLGRDYTLTPTGLIWTSTGLIPDGNTSYYVSYRKVRQESEYQYFESRNVEEMYAQGGFPSGDKEEAVLYGQIAFNTYAIPFIAIQPVKAPFGPAQYQEAIGKLTNRDIQTILVTSSDQEVRNTAVKHVKTRSLPQNKRERIYFSGMPEGTSPEEIATAAAAHAETEEFIMVSPTRAKVSMFNFNTSQTQEIAIDGAGIGTLIGLYRNSIDDPSYSLLRKTIPGFSLYESDYDTYFVDDALNLFGNDGVLQIVPFRDDFTIPMVVDELTTDTTNFKTSSIAVVTAKHYNNKSIREAIDGAFTGQKILDPVIYAGSIKNFLVELFVKLKKAGSMAFFNEADIIVRAGSSFDGKEVNPSKVWFSYKYFAIFIHKQTEGSYSLLP